MVANEKTGWLVYSMAGVSEGYVSYSCRHWRSSFNFFLGCRIILWSDAKLTTE